MGDFLEVGHATVRLERGDLTEADTDAIVNAANSGLMGGGGVDGAIHRAGGPAILSACKAIVAQHGKLPAGQAVITTAGDMAARHVIHTVGPIWFGGLRHEPETLASAYRESLRLAAEHGVVSIAFPSISTGAFHFPLGKAAPVALRTVCETLVELQASDPPGSVREVRFVLFDERTYEAYSAALAALD